ncbi:MAG: hypothetical protein C0483_02970 [Pirellula sp.]|nr:hypothetical protein [Pirellula sp.]
MRGSADVRRRIGALSRSNGLVDRLAKALHSPRLTRQIPKYCCRTERFPRLDASVAMSPNVPLKDYRKPAKIRVCHVQTVPQLAGAQRVMLDIFEELDRSRFELHVACGAAGPLTEVCRDAGIESHIIPSLVRSIRPLRDYRAYRELRTLFERERFDVVHTHSSKPGILGRLAARHAGVKAIVHHVQGYAFHEFTPAPLRMLGTLAERWAGAHCDRLVFVNHEEREWAIRNGGMPAGKCVTIYNGVDLRRFSPLENLEQRAQLRSSLGIGAEEVAVLFVGRLAPQKQPLIIPHVAKHLDELLPDAAWKILVAGSGPLGDALKAEIAKLQIERRVQLLPWQDKAERCLQAADILLQPTLWEGLPLAAIEAMGTCIPVVAGDVKGNREAVSEATGAVCEPKNAESFARALARFVSSPQLRHECGAAGRKRAERDFNAAVNYPRIGSLYEELTSGPASSVRRAA